uniref:Uncharacterized protein n=1 Tax=Trichobilharzia regenti TaxID=157069 RepID=A0AA85JNT2_TRIRE|nr:unnamed protein product [Trichobilharzia regenti]
MAGDPRLRTRFESLLLETLKDFIQLHSSLNTNDNSDLSSLELSVHLFAGALFIQSGHPVIITGPYGSGKSQLAIAINQNYSRQRRLNKSKIKSFRMNSVDFVGKISSTLKYSKEGENINKIHTLHGSVLNENKFMNNIIILEDVHLVSKRPELQRMWSQELRYHMMTINSKAFGYSSLPSSFTSSSLPYTSSSSSASLHCRSSQDSVLPIITTLDNHQSAQTHWIFQLN